jgi:hypothetical protein
LIKNNVPVVRFLGPRPGHNIALSDSINRRELLKNAKVGP